VILEDAKLGDVIAGRYRLEKILGEGGMGAVYEATQLNLNRAVALKLMHAAVGAGTDAKARFEREARVSGALHHPNAVKIFDFGEDEDGRLYLVMEKLRGTTLRSFVSDQLPPMGLARTVNISLQIAEVLVAAHTLGLTHRDLKPENIFLEESLDGSDRVVVVDFGLAFIEEREDANRMTQEGMIMGTPFYMSPEQCHGKGIGPPVDIYAFGCMLYEMVTSVVPFDGPGIVLLSKHVFEDPVPPGKRRADLYVPRVLERLILDMMTKKPERRPTPRDVVAILGQLEHTLGERERARGREFLEGREARMIPTVRRTGQRIEPIEAPALDALAPADKTGDSVRPPSDANLVAVIGAPLDSDVSLGLRANGFAAINAGAADVPDGVVAIFAPGAQQETLTTLLTYGVPVLTDTDAADDMQRVSVLLGMGVADVVNRPVRPEKLAKKLERAIRKNARRRGSA
jgi:serine/threonine-protein kinase